jgi:hypothetical protein
MRIDTFVWHDERVDYIGRQGVTFESSGPKMEGPMKKPKLPKTDSIQELAEFLGRP